jgi:hypothetical protein
MLMMSEVEEEVKFFHCFDYFHYCFELLPTGLEIDKNQSKYGKDSNHIVFGNDNCNVVVDVAFFHHAFGTQ